MVTQAGSLSFPSAVTISLAHQSLSPWINTSVAHSRQTRRRRGRVVGGLAEEDEVGAVTADANDE